MFELGARVTIMHITMAAESAWDQKIGIRAATFGIQSTPDECVTISRQADRYIAMTDGPYLCFSGSLGESCKACEK
jgi:hypothetical protein